MSSSRGQQALSKNVPRFPATLAEPPLAKACPQQQAYSVRTFEASPVIFVGLLFDDLRPQLLVDPLLDRRALIVVDVDGARQLDESTGRKVLSRSLSRMSSSMVHSRPFTSSQRLLIGADVRPARDWPPPGLFQQRSGSWRTFASFLRIAHALRLDAQDGDLVQQLAGARWGTRMSFTRTSYASCGGRLRFWRSSAVQFGDHIFGADEVHHAGFLDLGDPGQLALRACPGTCCAASSKRFTQ